MAHDTYQEKREGQERCMPLLHALLLQIFDNQGERRPPTDTNDVGFIIIDGLSRMLGKTPLDPYSQHMDSMRYVRAVIGRLQEILASRVLPPELHQMLEVLFEIIPGGSDYDERYPPSFEFESRLKPPGYTHVCYVGSITYMSKFGPLAPAWSASRDARWEELSPELKEAYTALIPHLTASYDALRAEYERR